MSKINKTLGEKVFASGRHFNQKGHEIMAKRLKPLIEKQINTRWA